jgi:hypothetical protein
MGTESAEEDFLEQDTQPSGTEDKASVPKKLFACDGGNRPDGDGDLEESNPGG